ncbi:hypothetical protein [Sphingobium fluviale]|uniref:Uncharacterized protein n=1 Tax=Sphingobium fluviale TaxID=2506423 RepID=A0A4Q1KI47_9SPHN|nr:hypothetical protein [Sphingobium fluviale]RXR28975.1 hypothetical protein EQG66_07810 [Sphingobium fluviale]
MPATASRIGFITQEYRTVTAGPDSTVDTKYGNLARNTDEPLPTFFDSIADAQAICTARHTLLKADRRRFTQQISGESFALGLAYQQTTPTVTVIDTERSANLPAAVVEIAVDFESETSTVTTWG